MDPVVITKEAQKEITNIIRNKNIPDGYGLRVTIKGGHACAGVNYTLGFDKEAEGDITYDHEGIKVIVRKKEMMFLMGIEVDFYDGADERGFLFKNTAIPNPAQS